MTYESKWGSDLSPQDIYEGLTRAFDIFLAHGETDMAVEAASQGIVGSPGWLPNPELTERALEFAYPESAATARLLTRHADTLRGDKSWIREASDAFDRGLEMARAAGDIPTQLRNLRIQAQYLVMEHKYESVLARRDAGLKVEPSAAGKLDLALLHIRAAEAECSLGMITEGELRLDLGRQICESIGVEVTAYHLVKAQFAAIHGRFDEAASEVIEIERLDDLPASSIFEFPRDAYTGDFASMLEEASKALREIPDLPETGAHRVFYLMLIYWIGHELGDKSAIKETEKIASATIANPPMDYLTEGLRRRLAVFIARTSEDSELANREYFLLLPESGTYNFHDGGPLNDFLLAQLAMVMNDPELVREHLDKALEFSQTTGLAVSECETVNEYAKFLLNSGTRVDIAMAVKILKRDVELAEERGLKFLGENMAKMLLAATQGRVVYPAGLTAREADVAGLLVDGKSNPQIAEQLFISLNTVLRHVSNIFGKLNVSNRAEAAVKSVELGLAEKK